MAAIECVNFISLSFSRGCLPLGRNRCRRKRTKPYENSVVGYRVKAYELCAGCDQLKGGATARDARTAATTAAWEVVAGDPSMGWLAEPTSEPAAGLHRRE